VEEDDNKENGLLAKVVRRLSGKEGWAELASGWFRRKRESPGWTGRGDGPEGGGRPERGEVRVRFCFKFLFPLMIFKLFPYKFKFNLNSNRKEREKTR
jgi:hypothetical protein